MSEPVHDNGAGPPVPSGPIADLRDKGDVEGLLALAASYRVGDGAVDKDLGAALECLLAAAELGSAAAAFDAAEFYVTGLAVERDVPRGVALLRDAAAAEHVEARIYLGNIYGLGIHYEADPEKADVWYRSAARAAGIEAEPGSPEHCLALAALGSARDCQEVIGDPEIPKEERVAFLKKAKALGLAEHRRLEKERQEAASRARAEEARAAARTEEAAIDAAADAAAASAEIAAAEGKRREAKAKGAGPRAPSPRPAPAKGEGKPAAATPDKKPDPKTRGKVQEDEEPRWTFGAGVLAFLGAAVFFAGAAVAGHFAGPGVAAALEGARLHPEVGGPANLAIAAAVLLFGVGPTFLLYRPGSALVAFLLGLVTGAAGYLLHLFVVPAALLASRPHQALASFAAGTLLILLLAGVSGGTRRRPSGD